MQQKMKCNQMQNTNLNASKDKEWGEWKIKIDLTRC